MRKLLYALAAVAAVVPLAAFGTASAATARSAGPAARPFNLSTAKCWHITDAGPGNFGTLYFGGARVISSHTFATTWCVRRLANGWQVIEDELTGNYLSYYAINNDLDEYPAAAGDNPTCDYTGSGGTANKYCEWAEFLSGGTWTIESAYNNEYITGVHSGENVKLATLGGGDQQWTITCVENCSG